MTRKPSTFDHIQVLRERYYKALPGKESLIRTIGEAEIPEHVYNSNAIENSTLSLEETEKILLELDLERFVSAREIHEAKNLARVMVYIENRAKSEELSLELMMRLHNMLIGNINEQIAGRFREKDEWVRIGAYVAPGPDKVVPLLNDLLTAYLADNSSHIITRLARFHAEFEHIHPFCDGNGRIGRVLNNFILLREGYVPINIAFADRSRYYDAFKGYDEKGTTNIMEEIIGRALAESYHKRLAYMEGRKIVTLQEYAKTTKSSYTNLLNKAERQTIEAFQEKGTWKIRADY
jgi:Fic family protein